MLGIRQLGHHQPNARLSSSLLRFITCVALIDKSHFHALARLLLHGLGLLSNLRSVLLVGGSHVQSQQVA